ncbi:DUF1684 domain-containing protein [Lunatimonas salinarum]|uniref:DUF1684 domain-containing protein n=1 Tax=Lunatimonas salinarum TaxID=1774590 RepID=UPI001ADF9799|nr:DUF1684 domain-containing protein [Lunatimonas salinarum]
MNFLPIRLVFPVAMILLYVACTSQESQLDITDEAHEAEMAEWVELRKRALTAEDGWLNLIGLDWLTPGPNRMGRGGGFEVSLPDAASPEIVGVFDWSGNQVFFEAMVEGVKIDGHAVEEKVLVFDAETGLSALMEFEAFRWQLIQRGDRVGVRLRQLDSEAVLNFKGVARFPRQLAWRKLGIFTPYKPHKLVPLANVLGQTIPTPAVGTVTFELGGKAYQLDAFEEGESLFLIFADESSGRSTYGGGRYLYAEKPDTQGRVVLDFNKAINPPCVFTSFATCPLPPKQHILDAMIEAGERTSDAP